MDNKENEPPTEADALLVQRRAIRGHHTALRALIQRAARSFNLYRYLPQLEGGRAQYDSVEGAAGDMLNVLTQIDEIGNMILLLLEDPRVPALRDIAPVITQMVSDRITDPINEARGWFNIITAVCLDLGRRRRARPYISTRTYNGIVRTWRVAVDITKNVIENDNVIIDIMGSIYRLLDRDQE